MTTLDRRFRRIINGNSYADTRVRFVVSNSRNEMKLQRSTCDAHSSRFLFFCFFSEEFGVRLPSDELLEAAAAAAASKRIPPNTFGLLWKDSSGCIGIGCIDIGPDICM